MYINYNIGDFYRAYQTSLVSLSASYNTISSVLPSQSSLHLNLPPWYSPFVSNVCNYKCSFFPTPHQWWLTVFLQSTSSPNYAPKSKDLTQRSAYW